MRKISRRYSGDHIADRTLFIFDGLRSYNALHSIADCNIVDCNKAASEEKCFYNLNTVNNFHSFIKARYNFYREVATKYLNRYNTLFAATYRCTTDLIQQVKETLLQSGDTNHYLSNREVLETDLLINEYHHTPQKKFPQRYKIFSCANFLFHLFIQYNIAH